MTVPPRQTGSSHESHGFEGEYFGEHVVMAIDVQHRGLVLLGARGYQQIGDRQSVVASLSELPVGRHGGQDRLGVDSQIAEASESLLDTGVVLRAASAIKQLQSHDRAQADLPELECLRGGPFQCRLVGEEQAA